MGEVLGGDLLAQLGPPLGASAGVVGLHPEDLDRVPPGRRPGRIGGGGRREQQPGAVVDEPALTDVASHAQDVLGPAGDAARDDLQLRAGVSGVARRPRGGIVGGERGDAHVVGVDRVAEVLAPGAGRRHRHQVLDVDRRQDGRAGAVLLSVGGDHADAPARLDDQLHDAAAAEDLAAALGDDLGERPRELARPAAGIAQLRRWRPKTSEYASGPEPAEPTGCPV